MKQSNVKKIDNNAISENRYGIAISSIYRQFEAIWKADSRCIVYETYIFINSDLFSYKDWKQN